VDLAVQQSDDRSPAKAALGTGPPAGSPQFLSATKAAVMGDARAWDERRKRGGFSAWLLLADREPEARSDADASAILVSVIVLIVLVQVAGRVAQLAELAAQLRQ
jgi:hypothetical protein